MDRFRGPDHIAIRASPRRIAATFGITTTRSATPPAAIVARVPTPPVTAVRERLRHVRWIGGGSGAGKSNVARRLAERYGLRLYATDDVMGAHARRSAPEDAPLLAAFLGMDADERWVNRSPRTMLDTFHWFHGEGFGLIIEDLLALPTGTGVLAEGFRLLPERVAPYLTTPGHAVWLLPTPAFRRAAFAGRDGFWNRTSDPARALRNLLERDRMFTDRLAAQTRRLGLHSIRVDGSVLEDALAERVWRRFA